MTRYKSIELGMGGGPGEDVIQYYVIPDDMTGQDVMAAIMGMLPEEQSDGIYDKILATCETREKAQTVVDAMNRAVAS